MSDAAPVFNISRSGDVIHEGLSLTQVVEGLARQAILPSDYYWTAGMIDWALVSSRQWVLPSAATPVPGPASAPAAAKPFYLNPASSAKATSGAGPAPSTPGSPPSLPNNPVKTSPAAPVEKGFSPYVTYYRSDDDRWAFGIFGGLAHRNSWPVALLLFIRILTLVTVFPAFFYLFGWGFTAMLLTPSLPTAKVKSYYDLNNGQPSRDSTDMSRLLKLLVIGFFVVLLVILFVIFAALRG